MYRLTEPKDALVRRGRVATLFLSAQAYSTARLPGSAIGTFYLEKARMSLAEIWRKNMDAMKESERTRTMKGSLWKIVAFVGIRSDEQKRESG